MGRRLHKRWSAPGPLAGAGLALNWTPGTGFINPFNRLTGSGNFIAMQWSDPLGASSNDYDLYILDPTGANVVEASANTQDGTSPQDPLEFISPAANQAGNLLVVTLFSGSPRFTSLTTNRARLQFGTDGQTREHNCAANAFGYGDFLPITDRPAFPNPFTRANMVETFSSDGFRRIFFGADGGVVGNGQFIVAAGGGVIRQKPDIAAADGAPTTLIEALGIDRDSGVGILQPGAPVSPSTFWRTSQPMQTPPRPP